MPEAAAQTLRPFVDFVMPCWLEYVYQCWMYGWMSEEGATPGRRSIYIEGILSAWKWCERFLELGSP